MSKKSTLQVEKANEFIVNWLKTYATNAKVNGFVVGISGVMFSLVPASRSSVMPRSNMSMSYIESCITISAEGIREIVSLPS